MKHQLPHEQQDIFLGISQYCVEFITEFFKTGKK